MADKTHVTLSVLLATMIVCGNIVSAELSNPGIPPGLIPGAPDVRGCWESLVNIEGCVDGILRAIFSAQFGSVVPACCKAFVAIDAACWPKMFPLNPSLPPILKEYCSRAIAAPPARK